MVIMTVIMTMMSDGYDEDPYLYLFPYTVQKSR